MLQSPAQQETTENLENYENNNSTENVENHQNNNQSKMPEGFMATTHESAKQDYGPDSPLDRKTKVFLMIKHHLVGNWATRMAIGKSLICRETGLNASEVGKALKVLAKTKMLLIEQKKIGGVWQENIYQLHPSRYGSNPLWQGDGAKKPTFQVLQGGKIIHKEPTPSVLKDTTPSPPKGDHPYPPIVTQEMPEEALPARKDGSPRILQEPEKNLKRKIPERSAPSKTKTGEGNGEFKNVGEILAVAKEMTGQSEVNLNELSPWARNFVMRNRRNC